MPAFDPCGTAPFAPIIRLGAWGTVDTVLAWIAFGSAVPEDWWNANIYFGASEWADLSPWDIPRFLRRVAEGAESLERRPCLHASLAVEAAPLRPGTATPDMLAAAAKSMADTLSLPGAMADAWGDYHAIRAASEDLRKALARDELNVFGRRGNVSRPPGPMASARERIPCEVFRAPVTVSPRGVLPAVYFHDLPNKYEALFSDLLLDGHEVLRIWPDRRQPPVPPEHEHALGKRPSAYSRADLDNWYEERVRSWPDGKPGPTEADDLEAARQEMGAAISRDAIRALRKRLAPAAWLKSGPRMPRG